MNAIADGTAIHMLCAATSGPRSSSMLSASDTSSSVIATSVVPKYAASPSRQ